MMNGDPPLEDWAKRVTVALGWLVLPMKLGSTTLVMSSEFEAPLAGRVEPARDDERDIGHVSGVGDRHGRAADIMYIDGDREVSDAAVDAGVRVGMGSDDDVEGGAQFRQAA